MRGVCIIVCTLAIPDMKAPPYDCTCGPCRCWRYAWGYLILPPLTTISWPSGHQKHFSIGRGFKLHNRVSQSYVFRWIPQKKYMILLINLLTLSIDQRASVSCSGWVNMYEKMWHHSELRNCSWSLDISRLIFDEMTDQIFFLLGHTYIRPCTAA